MQEQTYHVAGINPEPWVAPEASVGFKNGRRYVQFYTSDTVRSFKAAIKEELPKQNPHAQLWPETMLLTVTFYLWRQLDVSEDSKRKRRRKVADATNCQKLLEDSLQGILFVNDRDNRRVTTEIVEQDWDTIPHIAIRVKPYERDPRVPIIPLRSTGAPSNIRLDDVEDEF